MNSVIILFVKHEYHNDSLLPQTGSIAIYTR